MLEENNDKKAYKAYNSSNIFYIIEESLDPDEKIKLLNKADKFPREEVINALNSLLYAESNIKVLQHALRMVTKYSDTVLISRLVELLLFKEEKLQKSSKNNDEITKTRCLVAKALGSFKSEQAVASLLYVLNNKDENYTLRLSVAEALGKIGDKYAVMPLINIVSNEEEKSVYLRESAAKALGMLGDIRAVDPLIKILESKKGIIDKFTFLKERVIKSIGKIGYKNDKILRVLNNSLMDESSSVRLEAIEALSEISDERVTSMIEPLLNDDDEEVARTAIIALYNIEGGKYIEKFLDWPDLAGWCRDEIETILEEENEEYDE